MPKTVPFGTVFFWHQSDEIYSYLFDCESLLHEIVHNSAFHGSTFRIGERIERMSMRLIVSILYFDEYIDISLLRDNIDLSSYDRIVRLHDLISFLLEIADSRKFSLITYSAMTSHRREKLFSIAR